MRLVIAYFFPWLAFFTIGRPGAGIVLHACARGRGRQNASGSAASSSSATFLRNVRGALRRKAPVSRAGREAKHFIEASFDPVDNLRSWLGANQCMVGTSSTSVVVAAEALGAVVVLAFMQSAAAARAAHRLRRAISVARRG